MFHYMNNLFFGRLADGSVRILKFHMDKKWPEGESPKIDQRYPDSMIDLEIDPNGWASIVASVSKQGETGERFYRAEKFHNE